MSGELNSDFVKKTYDTFLKELPEDYATYRWEKSTVSRFHRMQTERVLKYILPRMTFGRLLEVGGGDGMWTPLFMPLATSLDFLDLSKEMLLRAQKRLRQFSQINFIYSDILKADIGFDRYDSVISIRNLEYMDDKYHVLDKYYVSLTIGGTICIVTKNPESDWKGYFKGKTLHSGQIPIKELLAILKEIGFNNMHVYPAIIGKGVRFAPVRLFWHLVQIVLLRVPQRIMPLYILRKLCESVLIFAKK